jgi:single-strand DNA-binding protein
MALGNNLTLVGTLGGDPELRFTTGGIAVASFSVAWNDRKKNAQTGNWEDGETSWFRCTCWRDMAENVAATLTKGTRVVVTGAVKTREWEDRDGNKRLSVEIDVDEVAPSLRWAQAHVEKTERTSGDGGYTGASGGGGSTGGRPDPIYDNEEPFVRDATIGDL